MMHRCSNSHGNMVGPCSCGLYHHNQNNSFSMLFSMPNHKPYEYEEENMYGFTSPSPSVDCTLSLGTPSTRLTNENEKRVQSDQRRSSCVSNFCWDILQSKHTSSSSASTHKSHRGSNSNTTNSGGDPLLARRCANCDTTSTPLWRNGPRGPKSLCNACGIRFKKEERRATAAAATNGSGGGGAAPVMDTQHMINSSWVHHSQPQRMPCLSSPYGNEFRFIEEDDHRDADTGIPFLSWHLNVADRPGLIHDYTR